MSGKALHENHVADQGIEHMLPRSNSIRIANEQLLITCKCSHHIRDEAIRRPIASTDDVPSSSSSNCSAVSALAEEAPSIGTCDQFSTTFAVAVGVITSEDIRFAI